MPANLPYGYGDSVIINKRQQEGCANYIGTVLEACQKGCCIRDATTGDWVRVPTNMYLVETEYKIHNTCQPGETYCLCESKWYCEADLSPVTTTP